MGLDAVILLQEKVVVGGVAARLDRMVGNRATCGMVGGETCERARVWVYRRYRAWVDWVSDWCVYFHAVGDCAFEYVLIFALAKAATLGAVILVSIAHLFFGGKNG